ncbi:MAG: TIR domain-containing protein [Phycisphaerales bacterium]|nr:TIR domain-containing protein [Phycisphaerales bacterium]
MSKQNVKLYVCFEPDQRPCAERLDGWSHTNTDRDLYDSRQEMKVESPEAAPMKEALRQQIHEADVTVCIISQTTFLNDWMTWELNTAKAKPDRNPLIGIILHEFNTHPPVMLNSGTMFVYFKRDAVEEAVHWAVTNKPTDQDFMLED